MPAAVNFQDTNILPLLMKATETWRDPSMYAHLKRSVPTLMSIAGNQTARFKSDMYDAAKQCRTYRMHWIEDDGSTSLSGAAADPNCIVPSGPKATSGIKNYFAQQKLAEAFSIDELECNETSYDDVFALKMLSVKAKLRNKLNDAAIVYLNANASTASDYTTGGTLVGNKLTYPTAVWENLDKIMYHIARIQDFNDITNGVLINGENLNQAAWIAKYKGTNGCCTDTQALIDSFGTILWDSRYLEAALAEQASFLFDANRVAMLNDWHYDNNNPISFDMSKNTEVFGMNDDMVSIKNGSGSMPLRYDVIRQMVCYTNNGRLCKRWNYEVFLRYGFYNAPTLNPAKTGIIKLVNA